MAVFPRAKAAIMELAREMIQGFKTETQIFPSPTVPVTELEAALTEAEARRDHRIKMSADHRQAVDDENKAFKALENKMKSDLLYAEAKTRDKPSLLKLIGWHARKVRQPVELPGQAADLTASLLGENSVLLNWKSPYFGGRANFYKIKSLNSEGKWVEETSTIKTEITLTNQPNRKHEYRVVSINYSGEGPPSNTVSIMI